MRWFAWGGGRDWGPAPGAGVGVGDGQGQGLELGDQGAEPAVVVEPLPVVVELLVGDEAGDGLAGPLPVGGRQDGRGGVAAAGLPAPAGRPPGWGAGAGAAEAGALRGAARRPA